MDPKDCEVTQRSNPVTMASWKIIPDSIDDAITEYTPLLASRKFFAVDASGSTAGSILRRERSFVDRIQSRYAHPNDTISLWGTRCDVPIQDFKSVEWRSNRGGTHPSDILTGEPALHAIRSSDVWFLMTDGEIPSFDVHRLATLAQDQQVLNVPLIFVITGSRGTTPLSTDISVGISFFASSQDTLILFKNSGDGQIYVIAGKGCFAALGGGSTAAQDLERWDDLPLFTDEEAFFTHCEEVETYVMKAEHRPMCIKGVGLGPDWEERQNGPVRVDLDLLLHAGRLSDDDAAALLAEGTFGTLAVACKTRSRIAELRALVQAQKIEQVTPQLEDVAGAGIIITKLGNVNAVSAQRQVLQKQLRLAHAKNREHYQTSVENLATSDVAQMAKKRNQLADAAMRTLASIEAAEFSAEILSRKSNRARRADVVEAVAVVDITKLDLDAPACKGFCLVCCDEDVIMSICFKTLGPEQFEDNTTDFALNFPLAAGALSKNVDLVSSQHICFQCAILAPEGKSIYRETLTAVIPALQYDGSNKKYINDQLYLALTAGLVTGAAGIAQLFMSILQSVLNTRSWAGAGVDRSESSDAEHFESTQRRNTLRWMLEQLVQGTWTREDFKETGAWVVYPQALSWVAKDFEANGLASFAVTYPAAGFDSLLRLGASVGAFPVEQLRRLRSAKVLHSLASRYLSELQGVLQRSSSNEQPKQKYWQQKYLEVIYQDFNGSLVPLDQGANSLVLGLDTFAERLSACISEVSADGGDTDMRKAQLMLFWLLFKQKGHCTAQTFFTRLRETEPLATAVLDTRLPLPESAHRATLLAVFVKQDAHLINAVEGARHMGLIRFANPFGASVLHCGAEDCNEVFCTLVDPEEISEAALHKIRDARTKHLITVFGISSRFEKSLTGLPERADAGGPPSSVHVNLHVTMVREWAAHTQAQRRLIVVDDAACEDFVKSVRRRLCAEGRGDVFQAGLDHNTRILLPSFFQVLKRAMEMQGRSEVDVSEYKHDFEENTIEGKVRWEMEASREELGEWELA
jgi:hypothetical protein